MAFDATDFIPAKVDPLTITDPRERLKYLAGFLRELPDEKFDITHTYTVKGRAWLGLDSRPNPETCGTAACILGWAQHLYNTDDPWCATILGLPILALHSLFLPASYYEDWFNPTPRQAAQVIDHLLLTGEVDWGVAS